MPTKKPLEKSIEAAVCKYARDKGCLAFKFSSPARAAPRLGFSPRYCRNLVVGYFEKLHKVHNLDLKTTLHAVQTEG